MFAPLPPNSRVTGVRFWLAFAITACPVGTPPVRTIPSTPECPARASPIRLPEPVMICNTSAGSPTSDSCIAFIQAISERGVHEAGFAITVHPAARAGAIERIANCSGKFHGTICAVTPSGCLNV